jgi:hypothetical protein
MTLQTGPLGAGEGLPAPLSRSHLEDSLTESGFLADGVHLFRETEAENAAARWMNLKNTVSVIQDRTRDLGAATVRTYMDILADAYPLRAVSELLDGATDSHTFEQLAALIRAQGATGQIFLPVILKSALYNRETMGWVTDIFRGVTGSAIGSNQLVLVVLDFDTQRLEYYDPAGYDEPSAEQRTVVGMGDLVLATVVGQLKTEFELNETVGTNTSHLGSGSESAVMCCRYMEGRLQGKSAEELFGESIPPDARSDLANQIAPVVQRLEAHHPVKFFFPGGDESITVELGKVTEPKGLIEAVMSSLNTWERIQTQAERDLPRMAELKVGGQDILDPRYKQRGQALEALERLRWFERGSPEYLSLLDRISAIGSDWGEEGKGVQEQVTKLRRGDWTITGTRRKVEEAERIKKIISNLKKKETPSELVAEAQRQILTFCGNDAALAEKILALTTQTSLGGEVTQAVGMGGGMDVLPPHHEHVGITVEVSRNDAHQIKILMKQGYSWFDASQKYRFTADLVMEINVTTGQALAWVDPRATDVF